jgi:short-subunit dehydrogenase
MVVTGRRSVMEQLQGRKAVVTGASGGIGREIARALARGGLDVAVSGRREEVLESLAAELRGLGVQVHVVPADLSELGQVDSLVERCQGALGAIDVLVNNAGVEQVASFTEYTREELISMVELNLTAPLLLTHRVVPGMLARGRGHVVFVASLAGKLGPPYNEPYAATKAALVGLTQSLRAEYLDQPVGFSVVSPGFVAGEGMYQRMVDEGFRSNRMMGETTTEKVAARVVEAIRQDRPEVVESGAPVRPMLALNQLAPRLIERTAPRFGVTEFFRRVAAHRGRLD